MLQILFPPRCVGCEARGDWLCSRCLEALPRIGPSRCRVCSVPTGGVAVCPACWRDPPRFQSTVAEFRFEGVIRRAIHRLKYRGARQLAQPLVDALLDLVPKLPTVDVIVAIPLHRNRQRRRGFNQASILAAAVSRRIEIPVLERGLIRVKDTEAQVEIPAASRWQNVRDAFQLADDRQALVGKRILLVDDVATTTSTLRAAARVLVRGGAAEVHALIAARATLAPKGDEPKDATFDGSVPSASAG
ncbi:MAG TPA: ComF family protein [Chloroflexota bacterium]|nr:ComF family protein [Chloroflexota bacterium]